MDNGWMDGWMGECTDGGITGAAMVTKSVGGVNMATGRKSGVQMSPEKPQCVRWGQRRREQQRLRSSSPETVCPRECEPWVLGLALLDRKQ